MIGTLDSHSMESRYCSTLQSKSRGKYYYDLKYTSIALSNKNRDLYALSHDDRCRVLYHTGDEKNIEIDVSYHCYRESEEDDYFIFESLDGYESEALSKIKRDGNFESLECTDVFVNTINQRYLSLSTILNTVNRFIETHIDVYSTVAILVSWRVCYD